LPRHRVVVRGDRHRDPPAATGRWRPRQASLVIGDVVVARRGPLLVAALSPLLVLAPILAVGGVSNAHLAARHHHFLAIAASLVVALLVTPPHRAVAAGRPSQLRTAR
jgi:hypothetical protein